MIALHRSVAGVLPPRSACDKDSPHVGFLCADQEQPEQIPGVQPGMVAVDADLLELKRGNLLLEREKLSLEIQILRAKMAKWNPQDAV